MSGKVNMVVTVVCATCGKDLESRMIAQNLYLAVEPCKHCLIEEHIDGIGDALDNPEPVNMVQFANNLLRGPR